MLLVLKNILISRLGIFDDFSDVLSSCPDHFHKISSFDLSFFLLAQFSSCLHYLTLLFLYPTALICDPLVFCYFLCSHQSRLFDLVFALFSHLSDTLPVEVLLLFQSLKLSLFFIDLPSLLVKINSGLFFLLLSFTFLDELSSSFFLVSNKLGCPPLFLIAFLLIFFELLVGQLLVQLILLLLHLLVHLCLTKSSLIACLLFYYQLLVHLVSLLLHLLELFLDKSLFSV